MVCEKTTTLGIPGLDTISYWMGNFNSWFTAKHGWPEGLIGALEIFLFIGLYFWLMVKCLGWAGDMWGQCQKHWNWGDYLESTGYFLAATGLFLSVVALCFPLLVLALMGRATETTPERWEREEREDREERRRERRGW
jgi:hypothetical protein